MCLGRTDPDPVALRRRVVLFLWVLCAACASVDRTRLFDVYQRYVAALEEGDTAAAEQFVSAGRLKYLQSLSPEAAHGAMNVISPKEHLAPYKESINGNDATLIVRASVAGNDSTGRVSFVRENGQWKIFSEAWDIGSTPAETSIAQPVPSSNPAAIRALQERGYAMPSADYLVMAAGTGDLDAVKLFVAAGYSVNTKSRGTPAIVNAASSGHTDVVLYLITAGADVNAVDDVNCTALMRVADHCDATEIVRVLLRAGARTDVRAAGGANALDLATYANCEENAKLIRAASVAR